MRGKFNPKSSGSVISNSDCVLRKFTPQLLTKWKKKPKRRSCGSLSLNFSWELKRGARNICIYNNPFQDQYLNQGCLKHLWYSVSHDASSVQDRQDNIKINCNYVINTTNLMNTSVSLTLYWCSISQYVLGIPVSWDQHTSTTAHNSRQFCVLVVPPEDVQVMPERCRCTEQQ
jgi:hypothetical protein